MNRSILGRAFGWLVRAHRRRLAIEQLSELSDYHLRDIGIDRRQISEAVDGWPPRTDLPVVRHGPMRRGFRLHRGASRSAVQ